MVKIHFVSRFQSTYFEVPCSCIDISCHMTSPFSRLLHRRRSSPPGLFLVCAVCMDGYARGLRYICTKCSDERRNAVIAVAVVVFVVFIVAIVLGICALTSDKHYLTQRIWTKVKSRFRRVGAHHSLKIVVVSWQITTPVNASMVAA